MDDGEPTQLSSTTRVVISVSDLNDNAPEFDQKTYNVEIPSNAKINQKLFQVRLRLRDYDDDEMTRHNSHQLHHFLTPPPPPEHTNTHTHTMSLYLSSHSRPCCYNDDL